MRSIVALITLFWLHSGFAQVPTWAKANTISKNGSHVISICEGHGSSVSIARQEAIQNCQLSVSQFLNGEVKINSISSETEKSVGYHQQVERSLQVKRLECDPQKDEVVQDGDNYTFWIKCKFDLAKTEVVKDVSKDQMQTDLGLKSHTILKSSDLVDGRVLLLETIPQCDSILVKGKKSRTVDCKSNPLKVVIYDQDEELILRLKDYQPKTVKLKGVHPNEKISVLFERN